MPSYNQAEFISRTLDSIYKQSFAVFEVIVVDGCSTDGTVRILQDYAGRYPSLRWISEPDDGPADAVNKGLQRVSGDIVGIQSSDDLYLDNAFAWVTEAFAANPDAGFLLGDVAGVDAEDTLLYTRHFRGVSWAELCAIGFCIPQSSIFFRRELIDHIGYWSGEYYGCDLDYWLRLLLQTRAVHVPRVLSAWRRYPKQRTRPEAFPRIWDDYGRMVDNANLAGQPVYLRRWLRASRYLLALRFPPKDSLVTRWRCVAMGLALHPRAIIYNPWRQYLNLIPGSYRLREWIARRRTPRPKTQLR